jgi:hypothetical protein
MLEILTTCRNAITAAAVVPGAAVASATDQSEVMRQLPFFCARITKQSTLCDNCTQVLKLKSLLSRAEIDKRSLQQQLDLKVRVQASCAYTFALTQPEQTSENKDLARICDELLSGMEKS